MMGEGFRFESPWALLLLALIPPLVWWASGARRRPAMVYSSVDLFEGVGTSLRARMMWLLPALRALGLAFLIVALARPQQGIGEVRTTARGVAIMAVIDRSGSMQTPMLYDGATMTRLDVVKEVFRRFVTGDGHTLKGRDEDLIGLVTFAAMPQTVCPLVRIHDTLVNLAAGVSLPRLQIEDGTAIGDGLALAAARLKQAEDELAERNRDTPDPDFTIASKVIILLTDGDENRGDVRAADAAAMCKEWGIRVYTIGIGGEAPRVMQTPLGAVRISGGDGFNEELLRFIADHTGGLYRKATDGESLARVYEEIDRLEKTEIRSTEFTSYRERFMEWAASGVALIGLELLLGLTLLRRSP